MDNAERLEQVRAMHAAARPKIDNIAWWNSHQDRGFLLEQIDATLLKLQQSELEVGRLEAQHQQSLELDAQMQEAIGVDHSASWAEAIETVRRIRGRENTLDVRCQELESRLNEKTSLLEVALREVDRVAKDLTASECRLDSYQKVLEAIYHNFHADYITDGAPKCIQDAWALGKGVALGIKVELIVEIPTLESQRELDPESKRVLYANKSKLYTK